MGGKLIIIIVSAYLPPNTIHPPYDYENPGGICNCTSEDLDMLQQHCLFRAWYVQSLLILWD